MEMMIRPSDESLEDGPDVLDVVGWSELPCAVVARAVDIAEELVDALIAHGTVGPDHGGRIHVIEEETVRRALVAVPCHADHDLLRGTFIGPEDDTLVPMPPSSEERFVHLHGALQFWAFVYQMLLEASEPTPHGDGRDAHDLGCGREGDVAASNPRGARSP